MIIKNNNKTITESELDCIMTKLRDFVDENQLNQSSFNSVCQAQDFLRRAKFNLNKIRCFECGDTVEESEAFRWYHADQDDLICKECAFKLKHTDTCYAGKPVFKK